MNSISSLAKALHIHHPPSAFSLSQALQLQTRLIATQLIPIKQARFGPNSRRAGVMEVDYIANRIGAHFAEMLETGISESDLAQGARTLERTIREIRCFYLHKVEHFFSNAVREYFLKLANLDVNSSQFGGNLVNFIGIYCVRRDDAEATFLEPVHEYARQIRTIINGYGGSYRFSCLQPRMKQGFLIKLAKHIETGEYKDSDDCFDRAGFRIYVRNQREGDASITCLQGAFKMHKDQADIDPNVNYYFRIKKIDKEPRPTGWRANHVDVCRVNPHNGVEEATAEIQVVTREMEEWGDKQREMGCYKDEQIPEEDRLPEEVKTVISAYCRSVADYIYARVNGWDDVDFPEIGDDLLVLETIPNETLQSATLDRIIQMAELADRYVVAPPSSFRSRDIKPNGSPPTEPKKLQVVRNGGRRSKKERLPGPRGSRPGPGGFRR